MRAAALPPLWCGRRNVSPRFRRTPVRAQRVTLRLRGSRQAFVDRLDQHRGLALAVGERLRVAHDQRDGAEQWQWLQEPTPLHVKPQVLPVRAAAEMALLLELLLRRRTRLGGMVVRSMPKMMMTMTMMLLTS